MATSNRALYPWITALALLGATRPAAAQAPPPAPGAAPVAGAPGAPDAPLAAPEIAPPAAAPQGAPVGAYPTSEAAPAPYYDVLPRRAATGAFEPLQRPVPPRTQPYWYGWQTLVVIGTSTALAAVSFAGTPAPVTGPMALGGFALGGPVVHWANGNVGMGFISLGMNVAAVAVGGVTGYTTTCAGSCAGENSDLVGVVVAVFAGGVGLVVANIVDATVLAHEERPVAARVGAARPRAVQLAPSLDVGKDRGSLGLRGVF